MLYAPMPRNTLMPPVPKWAEALKARRLELHLSQPEVSDRTEGLVAQRTVSAFERAQTDIEELGLARAIAYAKALNWTFLQFLEATGLTEVDLASSRMGHVTNTYGPGTRPAIPKSLKIAAEKLGDIYPELRDPTWQARLAGLMPQHLQVNNPQAWVETLGYLKRIDAIADQTN